MYEIEDGYWWYQGLHRLVLGTLKKYFGDRKNLAILDAGCGTGRMLELISKAGYGDYAGFDYSEEAVEFSRKRGLKNIIQDDLNTWQPEENKYDCLISLDVLYHSAITDDLAVIKKFYRALKPQGLLIMNLPAFEFLRRGHDVAIWTKKRYRLGSLKKNLRAAGFEVELASYRLPWLFLIVLAVKLKDKIFPPQETRSDLKILPEFLNNFFLALHCWDNWALLHHFPLLIGTSVLIVGRKK
jgi:SAM-dependent methyltransferase